MSYRDEDEREDHDNPISPIHDVIFYIGMFLAILWVANYVDGVLT